MNGLTYTDASERRTPWGTTGDDVGTYATRQEMLEAAGLANWDVHFEDLVTAESGSPVPGRRATVRGDNQQVLGIVGDRYKILSAEDAFAFGDNIVDDGQAAWKRAGSTRNGETIFGCMELSHLGIRFPGQDREVPPYLLIVNSFAGSTPLQGVLASIVPSCTNTFEAARGTKTPYRFSIRHTSSLEGRLLAAREALGIAFQHVPEVQEMVDALAAKKVTDARAKALLAQVFPIPDDASPAVIAKHHATQAYDLYQSSETLGKDQRGTRWGVMQAVTEYVDFGMDWKPRSDERTAADLRTEAVLMGNGKEIKDRALGILLNAK